MSAISVATYLQLSKSSKSRKLASAKESENENIEEMSYQ